MAKLFGWVKGNRGAASRVGSSQMTSRLETWEGMIQTKLDLDGNFWVSIGEKHSPGSMVLLGNVNDFSATAIRQPVRVQRGGWIVKPVPLTPNAKKKARPESVEELKVK